MPRPKKWPPTILHKRGRDYIRVDGRDLPLGPTGSDRAAAEYVRWLAVLQAHGRRLPPAEPEGMTVAEALAAWWGYADARYAHSTERKSYREALRPLGRLYGPAPVRDFGPRALKAVRAELAGRYCRRTANLHFGRIKRVFKWLQSEELVPPGLYHDLRSVPGLAPGEARESPPVLPVPEDVLARTLPLLGPVVREAVEVQLLTGCRPGELLAMRPRDLERGDAARLDGGLSVPLAGVWLYRPAAHKTAWRGHRRLILVGPKAQAVLAPLLEGRDPDACVFSPRDAQARRYAALRAARKSKVQPSQRSRKKARPKRQPGERYTVVSYGANIRAACLRHGIEPWHPHQLRHNAATRLVEQFGWDIARVVLGHRSLNVTAIYALDPLARAVEAVARAG